MKLYTYIHPTGIEDFLQGDFGHSLRISSCEPEFVKRVLDWIHIGEVEVEIDVDEKMLRQVATEKLDEEIQRIRAAGQERVERLEERKQNLLALPDNQY